MSDLRERFETLRVAPSADVGELDRLWADLTPVAVDDILGSWRGGDFSTGHVASTVLQQVRWYGKRFDAPHDAKPLVCRDGEGNLDSNKDAAGGGEASLWPVEFRGETTATMVYDAMPVFDHFKAVDGTTLMGIMNGKLTAAFGIDDLYYFWLGRDA